jgi:hypothetical protein
VANPSALIAALAERCMKEMSKDVRKRAKDARKAGQLTKGGAAVDSPAEIDDVADW